MCGRVVTGRREIYSSHMRFPDDPSQKFVKALYIVFNLKQGRHARGCELRELGEEERVAGEGWLVGGAAAGEVADGRSGGGRPRPL